MRNPLRNSGYLSLVLALAGCGVKGPPLPPIADTPEASERDEKADERLLGASPRPSPLPSPTPKPKSKRKR
jgi:predicted small lipoprotein YifL